MRIGTRRRIGSVTALLAAMALAVTAAGCSSGGGDGSPSTATTTTARPTTDGATPIPAGDLEGRLASVPGGAITDVERAGLLWMREEEKLARDVYATLGATWSLRIFDNITAAEETHMAAVATLLDRYGVPDPAADRGVGDFADPAIRALYDQLVARGRASSTEALAVGAAIEELDIVDLRLRATTTGDIALVYADLERGSRNHLRAFMSQLDARGVIYEPAHLDPVEFRAIADGAIERGADG